MEYLSITRNNFTVPLNLVQKKVIFETFLGFHYHEQNFSNFMKYILLHTLLICLQIVQLANLY
jgi:hypothetical protein